VTRRRPRYAGVLRATQLGFQAPAGTSAFAIVERLDGNATTDFGAPGQVPSSDARPVDGDELRRFRALLQACWRAFDQAVDGATGKALRKGPRGGGRDLEGIVEHVMGADAGYLSRLGWKLTKGEGDGPNPASDSRRAGGGGARRATHPRAAGRHPLDAALLCAAVGLARTGSRLGD
jgi:hypothetical protein